MDKLGGPHPVPKVSHCDRSRLVREERVLRDTFPSDPGRRSGTGGETEDSRSKIQRHGKEDQDGESSGLLTRDPTVIGTMSDLPLQHLRMGLTEGQDTLPRLEVDVPFP